MDEYVSIIFCRRCGSRFVEISEWSEDGKAIFQCRLCDNIEELKNFTLGRARISHKELDNARVSSARRDNYER